MFGYIKRLPDNVRKGVYITELVLSLLATIVGILIFVGVDVPTILGIFNLVVAFILMIGGTRLKAFASFIYGYFNNRQK